jgi:hypothetical protein
MRSGKSAWPSRGKFGRFTFLFWLEMLAFDGEKRVHTCESLRPVHPGATCASAECQIFGGRSTMVRARKILSFKKPKNEKTRTKKI